MNIIFDFDGTLADSLPLVIDIAGHMLGKDHLLNQTDIAKLRKMSATEILKYSGIPYWKVLIILVKGKAIFAKRLDELPLFAGMPEVVKQLHTDGHKLYLVSSNNEQIIRKVLRSKGLEDQFDSVYGNVAIFSKARALRKVLKDKKINHKDCIYIGDEVRDVEAAKKAGIPVIAVTWGYNSQDAIKRQKPDYIVKTPEEITQAITLL
jgi:phosphoglycolate phosphatase